MCIHLLILTVCGSQFLSVTNCLTLLSCTLNSVGATLPTGQLSNIPWRRTGVKYTNNEAYFDVIEEIDAIIDKSGSTVIAEIQGYVSVRRHDILCSWVFVIM